MNDFLDNLTGFALSFLFIALALLVIALAISAFKGDMPTEHNGIQADVTIHQSK